MSGKRAKGYDQSWKPNPETAQVLRACMAVFKEYEDNLPLTLRQVFYRLVGAFNYPKDDRAYKRLGDYLVKARRARIIPFDFIRDDGLVERNPLNYAGPDAFWERVSDMRDAYRRDRMAGQEVAVELWTEARGMIPQLQKVAFPYGVPVLSAGGFVSLTAVREIVDRVLDNLHGLDGDPTVFLHVGDYDPSGESIFESMVEDVTLFVAQEHYSYLHANDGEEEADAWAARFREGEEEPFRAVRVAVVPEQIEEYDLDTAPPKRSDKRSRTWSGVETAQAEAFPPDVLAGVVRQAIEGELDLDRAQEERDQEEEDREFITEGLDRALEQDEGS